MAKNHKRFHTKIQIIPIEPDNMSYYEDILYPDWLNYYDDYDEYYYYPPTEIESICDDAKHILCSFCPLYDEKYNKCLGNSIYFAEMQRQKKAENQFIEDFLTNQL